MRDEVYMEEALVEARAAVGETSPNPPVGAVLVKRGRVLSKGRTAPAGGPHAEIVALEAAGRRAKGATLYTTLEPCSHVGRTGPCTEQIINAGVSRVVIGVRDQNPRVNGRGIKRLRRAGIQVDVGIEQAGAEAVARPFFTWVTEGRPYVILKAAATLDGRIATPSGDSKWVTGKAARQLVHQWRSEVDAILVGAGTVKADDPRLTARPKGGPRRDPVRIVLDGRLSTDPEARVYRQRSAAPTWLAVPERTRAARLAPYEGRRTEALRVAGRRGRVELPALLAELGRREITTLLVEGGSEVHGQFAEAGLVDEVRLFMAPRLVGDGPSWLHHPAAPLMADARRVPTPTVTQVGDDLLLTVRTTR